MPPHSSTIRRALRGRNVLTRPSGARHAPSGFPRPASPAARFSTTPARPFQNTVFDPIRSPDSFYTHLSLARTLRMPLLTLWTASSCPACRAVAPLLERLVEAGVGQAEGGVLLAPVVVDSPDLAAAEAGLDSLARTYLVRSVPTLLSFGAGEAHGDTRVADARKLADRRFLEEWIRNEARHRGSRGSGRGSGGLATAFGGLSGKGQ